jgi:hypothetical protein
MTTQRHEPFGRPTKYNKEICDLICERVASYGISLKRLCKMFDDMPNPDTINSWRAKYDDFSVQYMNSRLKQAHILFENSLSDLEEIEDYRYIDPRTGATCVDSGIVAQQKALANHKTFMASKIRPKDYGNEASEAASTDNLKDVSDKLDKLMAAKQKEY